MTDNADGAAVRAARESCGLSQGEAADLAGVSRSTWQRIERGAAGLDDRLRLFVGGLGVLGGMTKDQRGRWLARSGFQGDTDGGWGSGRQRPAVVQPRPAVGSAVVLLAAQGAVGGFAIPTAPAILLPTDDQLAAQSEAARKVLTTAIDLVQQLADRLAQPTPAVGYDIAGRGYVARELAYLIASYDQPAGQRVDRYNLPTMPPAMVDQLRRIKADPQSADAIACLHALLRDNGLTDAQIGLLLDDDELSTSDDVDDVDDVDGQGADACPVCGGGQAFGCACDDVDDVDDDGPGVLYRTTPSLHDEPDADDKPDAGGADEREPDERPGVDDDDPAQVLLTARWHLHESVRGGFWRSAADHVREGLRAAELVGGDVLTTWRRLSLLLNMTVTAAPNPTDRPSQPACQQLLALTAPEAPAAATA